MVKYLIITYLIYLILKKGYDMTQDQTTYLAKTLWGEARGEGKRGMQAVGNVVLNRVKKAGWFGASVKDVVLKPYQFSCWNKADPNRAKLDNLTFAELKSSGAYEVAENLINGKLPDITGGATHYHAKNVTPYWAKSMTKTTEIGNHVFYK